MDAVLLDRRYSVLCRTGERIDLSRAYPDAAVQRHEDTGDYIQVTIDDAAGFRVCAQGTVSCSSTSRERLDAVARDTLQRVGADPCMRPTVVTTRVSVGYDKVCDLAALQDIVTQIGWPIIVRRDLPNKFVVRCTDYGTVSLEFFRGNATGRLVCTATCLRMHESIETLERLLRDKVAILVADCCNKQL